MDRNINRVIVALDNMSDKEIQTFLDLHGKYIKTIKIGMEAYYRYGRDFVQRLSEKYGLDIFLDLKLHDIPNTVSKAIASLSGLDIKFLTIHLSGGLKMINAASESAAEHLPNCKLLGVSVLTSLSEDDCTEIWDKSSQMVFENLYRIAHNSKIDGIVSSAHELEHATKMDNRQGRSPIKVCPGIRFSNNSNDDQQRVMTPKDAFNQGANYLVMGRAIINSPEVLQDPALFE